MMYNHKYKSLVVYNNYNISLYYISDPDLKQQKEKNRAKAKQLKNKHFCEIVAAGYVTVVHNIRASAKIIPKTAFLKGI